MSQRRLPVLSGKAVTKALARAGFESRRIRGSHHVMVKPGAEPRIVSVPVHGNRPLPKGTLAAIVEESGLSDEEFIALL
jgi:predicted RNA binding protein YcfA (HicA-like mRNA interferase family)